MRSNKPPPIRSGSMLEASPEVTHGSGLSIGGIGLHGVVPGPHSDPQAIAANNGTASGTPDPKVRISLAAAFERVRLLLACFF
jgi:hypothetical protein